MRPLNCRGNKRHELERQPAIEPLEGREFLSVSPLVHPLRTTLVSVPPVLAVQRLAPASALPLNLVGNYTGDFTVANTSQADTTLLPTPDGISAGDIRFAALSITGESQLGFVIGTLAVDGFGSFAVSGTIRSGTLSLSLDRGRSGVFNSTLFSVGAPGDTLTGPILVAGGNRQTLATLTLTRLVHFSTAAGSPSPINAITLGANSAQFFNGGPSFLRPSSAAGTDFGGFIGIQLGSSMGAIGAGAPGDATGVASSFNAFGPISSFASMGLGTFGSMI